MNTTHKVLVLGGGPDGEREVSKESSAHVAAALRRAGFHVRHEIIDRVTPAELLPIAADVIFPVLHGPWGEGGPLQDVLERVGKPYVGALPAAARLAMDKIATKLTALSCGVPTLPACILNIADDEPPMPLPVVIKPVHEGSTLGLHVCTDAAGWQRAIDSILADRPRNPHRVNMVERAVVSPRELTVSVLDGKALAPIEIVPAEGLYDYEAKYTRNDTKYVVAPNLPGSVEQVVRTRAETMFRAIGCRHLARVDFLLDASAEAWMLEVNTMPGFTSHSLFPMAAAHAGLDGPAITRTLVELALRDAHDSRRSVGNADSRRSVGVV